MAVLEVLYNSECPICDKEISHYKKMSKGKIIFIPISPETVNAWGLSEDQAAQKLHARFNGVLLTGLDAFQAIWSKLPYYRSLGKITAVRPIKLMLNIIYTWVLAPFLFKLHKSRKKRN
jgi:predicted DCC family thiol-disulfide oxidoreductase YuxK